MSDSTTKKDNPARDKSITITYAIFPTRMGKGYGCFAVKQNESVPGTFQVGASFCSPLDRAKFSKKQARDVALERLNTKPTDIFKSHYYYLNVVLSERNKDTLKSIIEAFMVRVDSVPRWVQAAVDLEVWQHTLTNDSLTSKTIIDKKVQEMLKLRNLHQAEGTGAYLRNVFSMR